MENNFPCICGHSYEDHAKSLLDKSRCEYSTNGFYISCPIYCQKYIPDNLKYLEQLYNSK